MEKYLELTKDEIVMGFVASCIEDVAKRLNEPYLDIFERMDHIGLIDNYIYPHYEIYKNFMIFSSQITNKLKNFLSDNIV